MPTCFLALPLPDKVRDRLAQEADRLRLSAARVSWVQPSEYHVTLHYFGPMDDEELLDLDPVLASAIEGTGRLALVARGLGTFPLDGKRPPRVVQCGVVDEGTPEEDGPLHLLRSGIEGALTAAGYRRDRSAFHPHVTLGRVREAEGTEDLLQRIGPARRREFAHFKAREVVLFESGRWQGRPVYTPLRSFRLG